MNDETITTNENGEMKREQLAVSTTDCVGSAPTEMDSDANRLGPLASETLASTTTTPGNPSTDKGRQGEDLGTGVIDSRDLAQRQVAGVAFVSDARPTGTNPPQFPNNAENAMSGNVPRLPAFQRCQLRQRNIPGAFHVNANENNEIMGTDDSESDNNGEAEQVPIPAVLVDEVAEEAHRRRRTEELTKEFTNRARRELIATLPRAEQIDRNEIRQSQEAAVASASFRIDRKSIVFVLVSSAAICAIIVVAVSYNGGREQEKDQTPSRRQQILDLVLPISGSALWDESTARYQAFDWVVNHDPMQLDLRKNNGVAASTVVERYVLALLFFATGGPTNWTHSCGFLSNTSVCNWVNRTSLMGVYCQPSGLVYGIDLSDNNMYGTMPPELSALSELEEIIFARNHLYGSIPSSLKGNRRLERITLANNNMNGTLPDLSSLRNFRLLELYNNQFSGTLPTWLREMLNLQLVNVARNLFSGTIPEFANQDRCQMLILADNMFSGSIPSSLGSLRALEHLALLDNLLTGTLPSHLGQLSRLVNFLVNQNKLVGSIPTELGLLGNLEFLQLFANQLTGSIPTELGALKNAKYMFLDSNSLTGTVPSEIALLDGLTGFYINYNNILDDVSYLCYPSSSTGEGLVGIDILVADCFPYAEVVCPCCTHCCVESTGICYLNYKSKLERCQRKAMSLQESSDPARGTVCSCSTADLDVRCMDTNCLYCNKDESICYADAEPGIAFSLVGPTYSVAIQYVKGRDEHVSFHYESSAEEVCVGKINHRACLSCSRIVCTDGFETFELDCSNLGYGIRSACVEGDDPFYDIWYMSSFLQQFGMVMPQRFDCVPRS